jgi:hypothetical protein
MPIFRRRMTKCFSQLGHRFASKPQSAHRFVAGHPCLEMVVVIQHCFPQFGPQIRSSPVEASSRRCWPQVLVTVRPYIRSSMHAAFLPISWTAVLLTARPSIRFVAAPSAHLNAKEIPGAFHSAP